MQFNLWSNSAVSPKFSVLIRRRSPLLSCWSEWNDSCSNRWRLPEDAERIYCLCASAELWPIKMEFIVFHEFSHSFVSCGIDLDWIPFVITISIFEVPVFLCIYDHNKLIVSYYDRIPLKFVQQWRKITTPSPARFPVSISKFYCIPGRKTGNRKL